MTAKEYLELLPDMQLRINAIGRQIKACDDRAKDVSLKLCESNGSSGRGKIEGNIEDKVDYEAELRKLKKEFEDFVLKAANEIGRLPTSLYSAILFDHYINGLPWETVAAANGYSTDYTRKDLFEKAISEFERIIPEDTRLSPCIPLPDMI